MLAEKPTGTGEQIHKTPLVFRHRVTLMNSVLCSGELELLPILAPPFPPTEMMTLMLTDSIN